MLVKSGPHYNVDQDAKAGRDQHRLWLDHELLVDHPENHMESVPFHPKWYVYSFQLNLKVKGIF